MINNLLSIDDFCNKYDLNKNSFQSMLARRYFPNEAIHFGFKSGPGNTKINEEYFLYKKKVITRIWLKACDNYYHLNEYFNDHKLSKLLHDIDDSKSIKSWNMFLYENLFTPPSEKITHIKITNGIYKFLRYSNWIIRRYKF